MNRSKIHWLMAGSVVAGMCTILMLWLGVGAVFKAQPNIPKQLLTDLTGQRIHLPSIDKKLSWVNFWSISCLPCLKELPILQKVHEQYTQSPLQMMAVAMYYDPPNLVKDVQERFNLTLPIVLDINGHTSQLFSKSMLIPRHFLIDSQGRVVFEHTGPLTHKQIENILQKYLSHSNQSS